MDNLVDVYVLDKDYQITGLIDDFITLIWSRKYYDTGSFELHCGASHAKLLQQGVYIHRNDSNDTGIIEEFGYSSDDVFGKKVVVKGRFLKAMLADRVIDSTQKFSGVAAGQVVKQLVSTYCINPSDTARKIPKLELANSAAVGGTITTQITGDSLLDAIERICLEQQISASIQYDFVADKLIFDVWQGLNRTQSQSDNTFAAFNEEFDNISAADYNKERGYKNYAYVAGAGEGAARIIEIVDIMQPGEERRELYIDARDLQNIDSSGNTIPEATYRQTLRQRGLEKLAEYQPKETIETKIDLYSNLKYKEDYDLGDLVTFVDATIGVMAEQRITEICEYLESGELRVDVVFGQEKLSIMQKIKREVK